MTIEKYACGRARRRTHDKGARRRVVGPSCITLRLRIWLGTGGVPVPNIE